jgi:hypothetical protein
VSGSKIQREGGVHPRQSPVELTDPSGARSPTHQRNAGTQFVGTAGEKRKRPGGSAPAAGTGWGLVGSRAALRCGDSATIWLSQNSTTGEPCP